MDESAAEEGSTVQVTVCRKKEKTLLRLTKKEEGSTLFSCKAAAVIRGDKGSLVFLMQVIRSGT